MAGQSQSFTIKHTHMEKLIKIQSELKAPKNQRNNFGNYNYRSCEDILEAVKPLLVKHGCTLTISDEIKPFNERIYVQATATLFDGKESVTVTAFAREAETKKGMDEAQITGAASSYARKYALNGLFLIDDTKDADATNTHGKETLSTPAEPQKMIEVKDGTHEFNKVVEWILSGKGTIARAKKHYTFTDEVAESIINAVQAKKSRQ